MSNDAISRPATEPAKNGYTFTQVDTLQPVVEKVKQLIATDVRPIALVTISLYYESEDKASPQRLNQIAHSTISIVNSLRTLVRKTDSVFLLNHSIYFLLSGANQQGGQIVQSRLWDALLWGIHHTGSVEQPSPISMSIGHSAYPVPYEDISEFLLAADDASLQFDTVPETPMRRKATRASALFPQSASTSELPALARRLGIPYLSLLPRKPPQGVQQLVNPKLAQELQCYPLGRERNMLTVAMRDPQDHTALDRLHRETGLIIFPVLTHPQELQTALEQLL